MNIPRKVLFWAVGLAHAANDLFMSLGPVMWTFIRSTAFPVSNAQVGLAISLQQMAGAFTQPFFGLLADRTGGRWLGVGGVAITVIMSALAYVLISVTGNFWLMLVPYVLAAVGSGAFHPVGSMQAAESDRTLVATSVSWFFLLGQLGLALGPLMAGLALQAVSSVSQTALFLPDSLRETAATFGERTGSVSVLALFAPLALAPILMMAVYIPDKQTYRQTRPAPPIRTSEARFHLPVRAGLILIALVCLRSLAQPGSVAFIPALFEQKGWTPAQYGLITSSFWVASGLAGVWFGGLADRFDRRAVLAVSLAICAPFFFLLPHVDGLLAFVFAVLAGGLSGGSHSLIVVLAQEMLPKGRAFASGAALGMIFGTGALGSLLIGVLSDSLGLTGAFHVVAAAILISSGFGLLLPQKEQPPLAVPVPVGD